MKLMITALGALTIAAVAVAFSHGPAGDPAYAKPDLWNVAGLAFLLALMGWMPAPLDIAAWSSLWILAKDKEEGGHVSVEASRFDFNLGYVVTGVLALFFVSFGALVMFGTGKTFAGGGLAFSRQLIDMYESTLGTWSGRAIGIVAFITMFSTSLTVCDGYTRTLIGCWRLARAGEQWPRTEAAGSRRSYAALLLVICAVSWLIIATWLRGLTAMVDFATILAFLTAPVVAWLNLAVARLGNMPAEHRPGRRMTVFSWVGIAYLTGFGVVYLVNLALA
jgi:Mn2+/Fe2+ NRAMP family transporter